MQINFPLWSQVRARYIREIVIWRTRTIRNYNGKLIYKCSDKRSHVQKVYSVSLASSFSSGKRCITYDVRYKETKNSATDNEIQTAKDKRDVFATSINLPYISYSGPVGATVSLKRIRSSLSNKDLSANYEFILSLSLSLFPDTFISLFDKFFILSFYRFSPDTYFSYRRGLRVSRIENRWNERAFPFLLLLVLTKNQINLNVSMR